MENEDHSKSRSARLAAIGERLRKIGDEADKRKFPDLVAEWRDEVDEYREQQEVEETIYSRLLRQAAQYIASWDFLENIYIPRTDNFLSSQ